MGKIRPISELVENVNDGDLIMVFPDGHNGGVCFSGHYTVRAFGGYMLIGTRGSSSCEPAVLLNIKEQKYYSAGIDPGTVCKKPKAKYEVVRRVPKK